MSLSAQRATEESNPACSGFGDRQLYPAAVTHGADGGGRTRYLILTKDAHYQMCYVGVFSSSPLLGCLSFSISSLVR